MISGRRNLDYLPDKKPIKDKFGRRLFVRAPELTYQFSLRFWQSKNQEMNRKIKRSNCQVVVLTPHQDDVTHIIYKSLRRKQLGKYPVATTVEQEFPDGELKILVENEAINAQSIYIVASILNERDFSRVRKVADHYKNTLRAKFVTLVCSYLAYNREDKNVTPQGEYEPNVTSIRAEIGGLSGFVDRMIIVEPHSSATQTCAALFGIPLAPISPWKLMVEALTKRIKINSRNAVVLRPDKGRNLAANRIKDYLKISSVAFEKVRLSGQAVSVYRLTEGEKELVKDKICVVYDDEASTMGTIYAIAEALQGYGAKSLAVCLVHCKFTSGWENKVKHPLFSIILGTDSRQPIGNINIAANIELTSLEPILQQIIKADIEGINFWQDKRFEGMLIQ